MKEETTIDQERKDTIIKMQSCAYEEIPVSEKSPVYQIFKMRKIMCQEFLKEGNGIFEDNAISLFNIYNESIKAFFNI